MLSSFDITQDFHSTNPHIRVLLPQTEGMPSSHIWGLFLFAHPDSKLFNETPTTRKQLVTEFLKDPTFSFEDYLPLLEDISNKVLTKAQRSLMIWEEKLHEREALMASVKYDLNNFEVVDKLITGTSKLWDQYDNIKKALMKEEAKTFGDQEESASEKGLI
jgi:hypothetical protein